MQSISLPDIMTDLERNDTIEVTYNSARSEDQQTAVGIVTRCIYKHSGEQRLKFSRHDGQSMIIEGDGELRSLGSHFPRTGYVTEIEIQ